MRKLLILAFLLAMVPLAANADCGSCGKCKDDCGKCKTTCKSDCGKCGKCDTCKPKCGCKDKCGCKSKCGSKCNSCNKCEVKSKCGCKDRCGCKPKCASKCNSCNKCEVKKCGCKDKCGCKSKCGSKCGGCNSCKPKCGSCGCKDKCGCKTKCNACCEPPKPACACTEWNPFCGDECCPTMATGLCISGTLCEGTAGPVSLEIRDREGMTVATVELSGLEGHSFSQEVTFEAPIDASHLREATIVNTSDDSATFTSFHVTGNGDCWSHCYFDYTCDGVVIGKDGCPRFVLF